MAHISGLCESAAAKLRRMGGAAAASRHQWRRLIPAVCPLCAGASRATLLCGHCRHLVTAGMQAGVPRCRRCCLALDGSGPCPDCERIQPAFDRVIAAFDYIEPADLLIHRFKVGRRFTDAPMLAGLLVDEVLRVWPEMPPELVLVPVPASAQSIVKRGFNPAAEIARVVARQLGRPYQPGILSRERDAPKQSTLGREARIRATARLYRVVQDVKGAQVAVVDDVMTTGSTMHSIARMLKRSGALSVHGLVVARTPHFSS